MARPMPWEAPERMQYVDPERSMLEDDPAMVTYTVYWDCSSRSRWDSVSPITGSRSQPSRIKRLMQSSLYADRFSNTLFFDRTALSFLSVKLY